MEAMRPQARLLPAQISTVFSLALIYDKQRFLSVKQSRLHGTMEISASFTQH